MPTWNKVLFVQAGEAFQEIEDGQVVRYTNVKGEQLFASPPIGDGCRVIEADVVPVGDMATVDAQHESDKQAVVNTAKQAIEARLRIALNESLNAWARLDPTDPRCGEVGQVLSR